MFSKLWLTGAQLAFILAGLVIMWQAFEAGQMREALYHCRTGDMAACDFIEEVKSD